MEAHPHRTNSNFQILHFLVGSCHTADGAYALIYSQRNSIEDNLANAEAQKLRRGAKVARAQAILSDTESSKADRLEARADIIEADAEVRTWELNVEAAHNELITLNKIMAELEPLRKYKQLPLLEANEACQQEEWKLELMYRAENFLLTSGTIPHDHFARMREHPEFTQAILPYVNNVHLLMKENNTNQLLESDKFNLKQLNNPNLSRNLINSITL